MGSVQPARDVKAGIRLCSVLTLLLTAGPGVAAEPISVAEAALSAAFYSDSSCLLNIDSNAQAGKTIIDADVDDNGSRMLIHCDTDDGRRLTLLARGDSLNVAQRVPLLTREEIEEGELGMIAWLTRSGVHYSDDSAPRRYVISGSVLLRKSPPVQIAGSALHSQRHAFGRVTGVLEPLLKSRSGIISEVQPLGAPTLDTSQDSLETTDTESADTAGEADDQSPAPEDNGALEQGVKYGTGTGGALPEEQPQSD